MSPPILPPSSRAGKTQTLRSIAWSSTAPPFHAVQGVPTLALVAPAPYGVGTGHDEDLICHRRIAPQYGLSEKAIRRHREHIPQLLVKAAETMELDDAEHLAAELNKLKQDVHRLKDKAEGEGDLRTALLGCDKALKALELQAKVDQLIQAEGSTTVNIALIEHPDYQRLSEIIYNALLDYPEARWAVADALKEIEGP